MAYFGIFFVTDDPKVERYIIRDCDCIINCQERIAVDEWIQSDKHFHIMRDYASHTERMHAGMWGGVRGSIAKQSYLCHDSHYDFGNSQEFNPLGRFPSDLNIGLSWRPFFEKACKTN